MGRHIGIVLGGGGLLGDFQVGALKYLYKTRTVKEDEVACIAGTSVGAINAVILATVKGCVDRLEQFWLQNVITPRDILQEEMWFEGVAPLFDKVLRGGPLEHIGALHNLIKALWKESREHLFEEGVWSIINLGDLVTNVLTRKSLYKTAVLKDRLALVDLREALRSKIALRLYAAELETGDLTCFCTLPKGKRERADDGTKYERCTTSEQLADAALASAALPGVFPPRKVRGRYFVDGSVREVVPFRGAINFVDIDHMYVILCMPRLAEVNEAAAENPEDASKKTDWDDSHLVDIALRSTQILVDELVNNDLDFSLPDENKLPDEKEKRKVDTIEKIAPLVSVHGMTDLNVGKVKINMDQGYMCAYDEVEASKNNTHQQCKQLTRLITSKRLEIWHLEHELIEEWSTIKHRSPLYDYYPWHFFDPRRIYGGANKVHTAILCNIRDGKRELKEYVDKRLKLTGTAKSLPDCYAEMYIRWELHNWDLESPTRQPLIPTPWHRFDLGHRGTNVIPEEEPPETTPPQLK
jgi:predicted acylesterase/phospholipase RssA